MYDSVKRLEPMRSVACGASAARTRVHVSASAQATHLVASLRSQAQDLVQAVNVFEASEASAYAEDRPLLV